MVRACVGLAVILVSATAARAHLGGAEGVTPFVSDGVVVGAGTTWGLVAGTDGAFSQTCEEAIGDVPRDYVRVVDDVAGPRILAATGLGLFASTDDGCTWTPTGGLDGRSLTGLVAAQATLWGITGDPGVSNDVIVSVDGGASFSSRATTAPGVLLTSLAVADDGGPVVVAGSDRGTPVLVVGDADGALTPVAAPLLEGASLLRALAVDDDAAWLSTLDGIGRGHLWRAPIVAGDVADVVDLESAVEIGAFDGLVRATGAAGGLRFVIAASGVLHRVVDAGAATDASAWERTTDGPLSCLTRVPGDARLWGCGTQATGTWFKATLDGTTWDAVLPFADVVDRACPVETPAASLCAYRFEPPTTEPPVEDDGAPDGDGDDDTGAPSCTQGPGLAPLLPVLLVACLGRRRRRG